VPLLNAANNNFNGNQNINNGNVTITNNGSFLPLTVQSSSTFGTWLELQNTSTNGATWAILSAGGANGEGAGSLGITNFHGGDIFLEGKVHANTLSVNSDTPMSSNPHMVFSGFLVGNLGSDPLGGLFIPDRNITITRVMISEASFGAGCSADAHALLESPDHSTIFVDEDLGSFQSIVDSGAISVSVSAGTQIVIQAVAASGCSFPSGTSPSNVMVNVQYVMQ